jgi:hypothetical protein
MAARRAEHRDGGVDGIDTVGWRQTTEGGEVAEPKWH